MRAPLCLVGLDGVPCALLRRLAADGVMPRVRALIEGGHLRPMRASLPEVSSVSWTSFMTGAQPGVHGVFGFTDIDPASYGLTFPTFRDVRVPTLWDRLGHRGLRSVVLNQPATYPARPIAGALVAGFVAIELARAVQPLRHLGPLRRLGYRIDVDAARGRRDHDHLLADLEETLAARAAAFEYLCEAERWHFLQVVVTGTDRLYHFLYPALEDPGHPRHERALEYHRRVDAFVGRVFDRFARACGSEERAAERFWMLSDHGFCAIEQEVYLNAWLREAGYLLLPAGARELTAIDRRSTAFALDPGRIYLHRADRFSRGAVSEEAAERLRAELTDGLRQLRYDGRPVVREVYDARELYRGPAAERGPDLVVVSHRGFDLKASVAAQDVFGRTELVGMHTYDDAFLLSARPLAGDLWIGDVAAHLLREMD